VFHSRHRPAYNWISTLDHVYTICIIVHCCIGDITEDTICGQVITMRNKNCLLPVTHVPVNKCTQLKTVHNYSQACLQDSATGNYKSGLCWQVAYVIGCLGWCEPRLQRVCKYIRLYEALIHHLWFSVISYEYNLPFLTYVHDWWLYLNILLTYSSV